MRMHAYYFGFSPTGVQEIDAILSAVACAGKAFHHTECWTDEVDSYEPDHFGGTTPAEWIQDAANRAARKLTQRADPGAPCDSTRLMTGKRR